MKIPVSVLLALLLIGCSAKAPPDMIEIVDGETQQDKYNRAVVVMRAQPINSELLEIVAVTNKYTGQVYLQCVIHDALRHDELLDECLGRVREALTDQSININ